MFANRKPALRHFAVIQRVFRSLWGSFWLVQDRRNLLRKQYLFVPSRIRAWPMWLKLLEVHKVSPARLRNGKVALLISDEELQKVIKTIKSNRRTSKAHLNALTGFQESRPKGKRRAYLFLSTSVLFIAVMIFPRPVQVPISVLPSSSVETAVKSCAKDLASGTKVEGFAKKFSKVQIAGIEFKIAEIKRLGGLAQLKIKRVCDSKYFKVDAWASGKELLLEKIY